MGVFSTGNDTNLFDDCRTKLDNRTGSKKGLGTLIRPQTHLSRLRINYAGKASIGRIDWLRMA
jgi:hypothetical protein